IRKVRQSHRQTLDVFHSAGENQGREPISYGLSNVRDDLLIPIYGSDKSWIDILDCRLCGFYRHAKRCDPRQYEVIEWVSRCRLLSTKAESNRSALHVKDRLVTVLSCRSSSQTNNELGFRLAHHLFESESRDMVAFIHDDLPILGNEILYLFLA